MAMKPLILLLLLALGALTVTGCARNYTMTLNSGHRITSKGKPQLQNGYYVYKDAQGQPQAVPAGRVREVAPSNMVSSRTSSGYTAEPMK